MSLESVNTAALTASNLDLRLRRVPPSDLFMTLFGAQSFISARRSVSSTVSIECACRPSARLRFTCGGNALNSRRPDVIAVADKYNRLRGSLLPAGFRQQDLTAVTAR